MNFKLFCLWGIKVTLHSSLIGTTNPFTIFLIRNQVEWCRFRRTFGEFKALKLTLLESFRALKSLKPDWRFFGPLSSHNWRVSGPYYSSFWRILGPYMPKTQLESFRVLILTLLESFRDLMLRIVINCLPNPCGGPLGYVQSTYVCLAPAGGPMDSGPALT